MIDILVSYLEQKRKQAKKNDAYVTARAYSPLIDAIKLTKSALKAVGHLGLVAYKVVNGLFHKSAEKAFSGSPDWEEFATKEKQADYNIVFYKCVLGCSINESGKLMPHLID